MNEKRMKKEIKRLKKLREMVGWGDMSMSQLAEFNYLDKKYTSDYKLMEGTIQG